MEKVNRALVCLLCDTNMVCPNLREEDVLLQKLKNLEQKINLGLKFDKRARLKAYIGDTAGSNLINPNNI